MKCPICNYEFSYNNSSHIKGHYRNIKLRLDIFLLLKEELKKDYEKLKKVLDDKEAELLANEILNALR